jgi:hypothetical protein
VGALVPARATAPGAPAFAPANFDAGGALDGMMAFGVELEGPMLRACAEAAS